MNYLKTMYTVLGSILITCAPDTSWAGGAINSNPPVAPAGATPAHPESLDLIYTQRMAVPSQLPEQFVALEQTFHTVHGNHAKRQTLDAILTVAREIEDQNPDAAAAMTNYAAYRTLYDIENSIDAAEIFRQVADGRIASGKSPMNTVDAWRMIGQIEMLWHSNRHRAIEAYDNAITTFENAQKENQVAPVRAQYLMSLMTSAWALSDIGDHAESIARREKVLAHPDAAWLLQEDQILDQYLEIARSTSKSKPGLTAFATYERLLNAFPEHGQQDGLIVYFRYEQLGALGLEESEIEYTTKLKHLWNNPEFKRFDIQQCRIGHKLASIHLRNGNRKAYRKTLLHLVNQLDDVFQRYELKQLAEHEIDHVYALSLCELARIEMFHTNNTDAAVKLYHKFLDQFPTHHMADTIRERVDRLSSNPATRVK